MLLDIDTARRTGALRVVLQGLADGPEDFAPVLATAVLYIIDAPATRAYFRPGMDLEVCSGPVFVIC